MYPTTTEATIAALMEQRRQQCASGRHVDCIHRQPSSPFTQKAEGRTLPAKETR
jgi:hypothetical protein